jgi:hypothetical protein
MARPPARPVAFGDEICPVCGLSPYPRGWVVNLGVCWTCWPVRDNG